MLKEVDLVYLERKSLFSYQETIQKPLERKTEIINCNTLESLPSTERILAISRESSLTIIFGKNIRNERESIGQTWKSKFPDFLIRIYQDNFEINIARLITKEEIIALQLFFENCAKDYRMLATKLINELANHLRIVFNPDYPLQTFNQYKNGRQKGEMNAWKYFIHGFDCGFENKKTRQVIEVSLVFGLEFGTLDPYFFTRYIKSTDIYKPLPVEIYEDYHDGVRILEKMEELGKFEKINSNIKNHYGVAATDREKIAVNLFNP
jgi:hypothetical protein